MDRMNEGGRVEKGVRAVLAAALSLGLLAACVPMRAHADDAGAKALGASVERAHAAFASAVVSADGKDVYEDMRWATRGDVEYMESVIAAARVVLGTRAGDDEALRTADEALGEALAEFRAAMRPGLLKRAGATGSATVPGATVSYKVSAERCVSVSGAKAGAGATVTLEALSVNGVVYQIVQIAPKAFAKTKAKKVKLGDGVVSLGSAAFANAKKLRSFEAGSGLVSVGAQPFKGCKKLKSITLASAGLSKKACGNLVRGSKVTRVKLVGAARRVKGAYRKLFPKKNAGKKLKVV